jgi:glucans biosynthesis protein
MHLFGESQPQRVDPVSPARGTARPEVHDSDHLALLSQTGERLARPLENPVRTRVTHYRLDSPRGFGLLQRDRAADSYRDTVERYEQRPSAWVEPEGDWGPGQLRLLEFATELESDDNIALLWQPDRVPSDELRIAYSLTFGTNVEPTSFGRVTATRQLASAEPLASTTRQLASAERKARFELDFAVPNAELVRDPVELSLSAPGASVVSQHVERRPGGFRARFEISPARGHARVDLAPSEQDRQTELRAFLRSGADVLTETWSYPWQAN